MFDNAIETTLTIGRWSALRNDERITRQVIETHAATSDAGRFNKQLLPKSVIDPIARAENSIRRAHHSFTLPWREGTRLLASDLYLTYTQQMGALKDAFYRAVNDLVNNYPTLVEQRKLALNGMFNADDYPSQMELLRKHYVRITFDPVSEFEAFRKLKLSGDVVSQIMSEAQQSQKQRYQQAQYDLWLRLKEHIKTIVNGTQPDAKFIKSTFENLEKLVDIVSVYSKVFNSPDLDAIQQEVRRLITDRYSAEELQKQFNGNHALVVREEVNQVSKDILQKLEDKIKCFFS